MPPVAAAPCPGLDLMNEDTQATGAVGPEYRCGVDRLRSHAQLHNGSNPVVIGLSRIRWTL
jgi:hypothetical protein